MQPRRLDLSTTEIVLALCRARDIERGFGPGGHTTRATQDAAIAALNATATAPAKEPVYAETRS